MNNEYNSWHNDYKENWAIWFENTRHTNKSSPYRSYFDTWYNIFNKGHNPQGGDKK